jgi:hypothetical protein
MPSSGPVELRPIGYVRTRFERLEDTPIQSFKAPDEPGRLVVLDPEPPDGAQSG